MKTGTLSAASIQRFTVTILAAAAVSIAITVSAADRLSETLQKGLFEEEANHNLEAAIKVYEAVIDQSQEQRRIAATALFRLGECYRKLNKTNEAAGSYQRLLRDFSDQTTLVNLSRQNLSVLGIAKVESKTQLAEAATRDEAEVLQRIRAMIKDSPDLINARGQKGAMPLHEAADAGQLSVARFLLANGADVNGRDDNNATPLHYAAWSGHKALCEVLLANGADPEAVGSHWKFKIGSGATPLHLAVRNGYQGVSETLLQHKANPNAQDGSRQTALHVAAARGHLALAELLLTRGADVNAADNKQTLPLHEAAGRGSVAMVKLFLSKGAAVDRANTDLQLPLHTAVGNGSSSVSEIVRLLAEKGCDINARGHEGKTALHIAAERNAEEVMKAILELKPNVDVENGANWTPLLVAVGHNALRPAQLLLEAGANPNLLHSGWGTPLIAAISKKQFDMVALLLKHKADPNLANASGATPLAFARSEVSSAKPRSGSEDARVLAKIAALLIEHGADQNVHRRKFIALGREGQTPWNFFTRDDAGHNHHTLYELIAFSYQGRNPYNSWSPYSFPDFSRMTIERLANDGKGTNRIPVNLDKQAEDIPLEWGDIVFIPTKDHQLHEIWQGLPLPMKEDLQRRPLRTVTLHIKGKTAEVTLRPELKRNVAQSSGLPVSGVEGATVLHWPSLQYVVRWSGMLFASSDLTRVKVKRSEPGGKEARILIFNLENKSEDLWLQDGDIIDVPDKES